jgi:hypothetical protein
LPSDLSVEQQKGPCPACHNQYFILKQKHEFHPCDLDSPCIFEKRSGAPSLVETLDRAIRVTDQKEQLVQNRLSIAQTLPVLADELQKIQNTVGACQAIHMYFMMPEILHAS